MPDNPAISCRIPDIRPDQSGTACLNPDIRPLLTSTATHKFLGGGDAVPQPVAGDNEEVVKRAQLHRRDVTVDGDKRLQAGVAQSSGMEIYEL